MRTSCSVQLVGLIFLSNHVTASTFRTRQWKEETNEERTKEQQYVSSVEDLPWRVNDDFSWCVPNYKESHPTGLLYVKVEKTASSTTSGVALRIAHKVGERVAGEQRNSEVENGEDNKTYDVDDEDRFTGAKCAVQFRHGIPRSCNYENRNHRRSYLWSMVRDPTARALSDFYFFHVSREGVEPTDENIIEGIKYRQEDGEGGHQFWYLFPTDDYERPITLNNTTYIKTLVKKVLNTYDFIGVVERYDESVVALRLLLGIEAGDVLHINSKVDGYDSKCNKIIQRDGLSPAVKSYLKSHDWLERNVADTMLHEMANRKLNATINAIGTRKFAKALHEHRKLTKLVNDKCANKTIHPCMNGVFQGLKSESNCYWNDFGCGYPCVDEVTESLKQTV